MTTHLEFDEAALTRSGASWTAREIAQQPGSWRRTQEVIRQHAEPIARFLTPLLARTDLRIILTGAGSSAFIGECLAPLLLRELGRRVEAIATTDLLSGPMLYLQREIPTLLVSFGRSGSSPESVAVVDLAERLLRECHQLVFTCNEQGTLYRRCRGRAGSLAILMPPETHDQSFAMTSSFTAMMLAASLVFSGSESVDVERLARAAQDVMAEHTAGMRALAAARYSRVVYLGSNGFKALAREAALKLLELTDGGVVAAFDSPLGFRHGPKTIVTADTLVFVFVSNDPYTRAYDLDLLRELRSEAQAGRIIAITAQADDAAARDNDAAAPGDCLRVAHLATAGDDELCFPYIVCGQLYAFHRALALGNTPDQPSRTGTVTRVVHGVAIHPPVSTALYLGVDGGGTKTALVLIDSDGTIRATHLAPGSYYVSIGLDALETVLADGVGAVLDKAAVGPEAVDFAFFGLPAYGEDSALLGTLSRLPQSFLRPDAFLCGNDMVCGWAGSLLCRDGISIVAGTGSICYGERGGAVARSGGWGELFSDEGSAYWIACRGLNLFSRMSDGRRVRGPFYELAKESLNLAADLDLCAHVFSRLGGDRAEIAQLSRLVTRAAQAGDEDCRSIIGDAAAELALLVEATRRQLGFTAAESVAVSYSGGVFEHVGAPLVDAFTSRLEQYDAGYRVVEPSLPPAVGAALYAAKRHGRPLSDAAVERLRGQSGAQRGSLES